MSERFYVNSPLDRGPVTLQGTEARHLTVVCRLRPGDAVCLFNGDGREYQAEITAASKREVELTVTQVNEVNRELPFRLVVGSPLPKGDRGQFLIEKLTELGVSAFVPLKTERSVIHPGEGRIDKLERHVIEACKQCGRNVLMKIENLTPWNELLARADLSARKWVAHPGEPAMPAESRVTDTVLAIGPEGGFTPDEIEAARSAGWQFVSLGPRVLRMETAAIALAAAVSMT